MDVKLFVLFVALSAISMTIGAALENWNIRRDANRAWMRLLGGFVVDIIGIALLSLLAFVGSHVRWQP